MNSPEGKQWYPIDNKNVRLQLHDLFIQFSILLNIDLKDQFVFKHLSEWCPVQMGWFTSSYCSCRSRIG